MISYKEQGCVSEDNAKGPDRVTALFIAAVPSHQNRYESWVHDRQLYKRRNEVKRPFRRLKGFH